LPYGEYSVMGSADEHSKAVTEGLNGYRTWQLTITSRSLVTVVAPFMA
jgi:hypothetical protein